jgi:hypothetical protein
VSILHHLKRQAITYRYTRRSFNYKPARVERGGFEQLRQQSQANIRQKPSVGTNSTVVPSTAAIAPTNGYQQNVGLPQIDTVGLRDLMSFAKVLDDHKNIILANQEYYKNTIVVKADTMMISPAHPVACKIGNCTYTDAKHPSKDVKAVYMKHCEDAHGELRPQSNAGPIARCTLPRDKVQNGVLVIGGGTCDCLVTYDDFFHHAWYHATSNWWCRLCGAWGSRGDNFKKRHIEDTVCMKYQCTKHNITSFVEWWIHEQAGFYTKMEGKKEILIPCERQEFNKNGRHQIGEPVRKGNVFRVCMQ